MAHFESDEIGVSFDLPDEPTVFEVIQYDSTYLERQGDPAIVILWECIKPLLRGWECAALQDYNKPLNTITGADAMKAASAVEFAAFRGRAWRTGLDTVSKN